MTILHVLEPFASGVTTAVIGIIGELAGYRHIVVHGSRNWVDNLESVRSRFPSGVTFIEWKSAEREISLKGDLNALFELVAVFRAYRAEKPVIHLHSSKAGFLGRLAARLTGLKAVVYTPHCGAFLRRDISLFKRAVYWSFEKMGGFFGGRVVGCGPSEAEAYKKLGKDTGYVSNGVAPRRPRAGGNSFPYRNLVGFSGIASFQKDPALFNEIASRYAEKAGETAPAFSFYWIGDGPLRGELDEKTVTLTGWKSAADVECFLDRMAVYLSASAWEGLPYGVLEAMNASCALLLRNVPGNRDLVVPGVNGWLFDTAEEAVFRLAGMLADAGKTAKMGEKSLEILKKSFTLEAMGESWRKVYVRAAEAYTQAAAL